MKTMHVVRIVLMMLAMAPPLVLGASHAEGKAPTPPAELTALSATAAQDMSPGVDGGPTAKTTPAGPLSGSDEDIRDVRGPREIPNPWWWAGYAGAAFLGLLLLYAVWRILGRRKQLVKSAHERAFEALQGAREFMQPEHAREFSFRVSGAVRLYIEERFSVRSTQQTTSEFLRAVSERDSGPLAAQRVLLAEFLKNCDLVKFARFGLTREEMESMFDSAWQFVDTTKPDPEESPKAGSWSPVSGIRRRAVRPQTGDGRPETGPNLMVGGVS